MLASACCRLTLRHHTDSTALWFLVLHTADTALPAALGSLTTTQGVKVTVYVLYPEQTRLPAIATAPDCQQTPESASCRYHAELCQPLVFGGSELSIILA